MKVEVDDKYLAFLEMEYVKKVFGDDFFRKIYAAPSEKAAERFKEFSLTLGMEDE